MILEHSTTPAAHTTESRRASRALCALLFTGVMFGATLATSAPAHAGTESRAWAGALFGVNRPGSESAQLGTGAQLGMSLSLGDFWTLLGGADLAYHFARDTDPEEPGDERPALLVSSAFFGAQYNLDIISYVPFVGVSAVFYPTGPGVGDEDARALFGGKLSVGLQWRPAREWSLAGVIDLHGTMPNLAAVDLYATIGLNFGYHWRW